MTKEQELRLIDRLIRTKRDSYLGEFLASYRREIELCIKLDLGIEMAPSYHVSKGVSV